MCSGIPIHVTSVNIPCTLTLDNWFSIGFFFLKFLIYIRDDKLLRLHSCFRYIKSMKKGLIKPTIFYMKSARNTQITYNDVMVYLILLAYFVFPVMQWSMVQFVLYNLFCFRLVFDWRTFHIFCASKEETLDWVKFINWKLVSERPQNNHLTQSQGLVKKLFK